MMISISKKLAHFLTPQVSDYQEFHGTNGFGYTPLRQAPPRKRRQGNIVRNQQDTGGPYRERAYSLKEVACIMLIKIVELLDKVS